MYNVRGISTGNGVMWNNNCQKPNYLVCLSDKLTIRFCYTTTYYETEIGGGLLE